MKKIYCILIIFVTLLRITYSNANNVETYDDDEYPNSNESELEETDQNHSTEAPRLNTTDECSTMKFYCESCREIVMCISTEYGFTKQYVACPPEATCLRGMCTTERNPLCDGTSSIPFKCHVPGIFPDPFDCKKYHFCVPLSSNMVNYTLNLKHFEHSCQKNDGVEYSYDPRSQYCKNELSNGCQNWPVSICQHEAHTEALVENNSIFFVCENVNGNLYPNLYACPNGEEYNQDSTKCEKRQRMIPIESYSCRNGWRPGCLND